MLAEKTRRSDVLFTRPYPPLLSLVLPLFNEEEMVPHLRERLESFIPKLPCPVEIILVNDGSSDGTLRVVEGLRRQIPGAVQVVHLDRNEGKAEAVRQGVLRAARSHDFPLIGFWDADLSTPLDELPGLLHTLERDPACELAMGARVRRLGSAIHRSAARHYLGRLFSTAASLLLRLPVYDSQCGAKVFRADAVPIFFKEPFLTRWLFDLEILVRFRNQAGLTALEMAREVPLRRWQEVGGSKLKLSDMAGVPRQLLMLRKRYNKRS